MQLRQIYDMSQPSSQWKDFKFNADSCHPLVHLINSVHEHYSVQIELRVKTHQPWWEHQIRHAKFTVELVPAQPTAAVAAAAEAKRKSLEQEQQQQALQQQRERLEGQLTKMTQKLKAAEDSKAELQAKLEQKSSEVSSGTASPAVFFCNTSDAWHRGSTTYLTVSRRGVPYGCDHAAGVTGQRDKAVFVLHMQARLGKLGFGFWDADCPCLSTSQWTCQVLVL